MTAVGLSSQPQGPVDVLREALQEAEYEAARVLGCAGVTYNMLGFTRSERLDDMVYTTV